CPGRDRDREAPGHPPQPEPPVVAGAAGEGPPDPEPPAGSGPGAGRGPPGLGDRTVRLRGAAGLDRRAASGDARPAPRRPGGGGQGARRRRAGGDDGPPGGGAGRQGARPGERRDRRPAARSEARGLVLNLSEPFIRRPVMTAVLTVAVMLFGALSYRQL